MVESYECNVVLVVFELSQTDLLHILSIVVFFFLKKIKRVSSDFSLDLSVWI